MSRFCLLIAIPISLLFICPKPAQALPQKGNLSLSVGFPGGGDPITGGAGIWWMVNRRINLGLSFNFSYQSELSDIQFGPAMRYYLSASSPVAAFLYAELDTKLQTGDDNNDDTTIHALIGFGAEWFINRSVSIAVYTGLAIRNLVGDQDSKITTVTSGLTAQFYFSSL